MKRIRPVILAIALALAAQTLPARPTLRFEQGKPLKILQLTDLHYIHGDSRASIAIDNIHEMISSESPDLVMVTGDLIYGFPNRESMKDVLDAIASYDVPFALTFGNHDDEFGLSRSELLEMACAYEMNLSSSTDGISGVTNYVLPVESSGGGTIASLLYVFDSHAYSRIPGVQGYDHVHFDQIQWYIATSRAYAEESGKPVPALAFLHIPLPEYSSCLREGAFFVGTRRESGGEAALNSGLFAAALEMGDIRGFFAGHDHDDDYLAFYRGIALAYGRYGGGDTEYNHLKPCGARVIEIFEDGSSFRTYIRLMGDAIIHDITVPAHFVDKQ